MSTKEEIRENALTAVEQDDWDKVISSLHTALLHLPSFAWIVDEDAWKEEELHDLCHQIGEAIYLKAGFRAMQEIWYQIDKDMSGMGSRPLEKFWDGCGNGAWQA